MDTPILEDSYEELVEMNDISELIETDNLDISDVATGKPDKKHRVTHLRRAIEEREEWKRIECQFDYEFDESSDDLH